MITQTLNNCISEETAYISKDYPWGFSMRTQVKFWVEETKLGMRFVKRTLNPKTNCWCAPKKSTYSQFIALYLDENNHVKYQSYESRMDKESKEYFKEIFLNLLNDKQKADIERIDKQSMIIEGAFKRAREIAEKKMKKRNKYNGFNRFDYLESLGFKLVTSINLFELGKYKKVKGTRKNSGDNMYYPQHLIKKSDLESMNKEQKEEYANICLLDNCA